MKCKDCLSEISDKEYYNKSDEGVCKKCRQRKSQIKYENKKFGTNKEYVPLRLKHKVERKSSAPKVVKEKDDETKLYGKDIEKKVNNDIQAVFNQYGVEIKDNDRLPFLIFMNMFNSLLDIKNGFMSNYIKAEDIFNNMERDYQHAFEDSKTVSEMDERSKMFKCLLDKRRNVKNINIQYEQISRIIYEIIDKIPNIVDKVNISIERLTDIIQKQEDHYYKAEVSELIQQADFCKGTKPFGKAGAIKYDVSVPLFNFGNNRAGIPYDFHRYAYGKNQQEAIDTVKAFISKKLPKCTYKPNDFLAVELYEDIVSQDSQETEVCL